MGRRIKLLSRAGLLSLVFSSAGCFSSAETVPDQQPEAVKPTAPVQEQAKPAGFTLDIFSARGFLGGSDYERYFLKDDLLWRECGSLNRSGKAQAGAPIEGDEVLKQNPALDMRERRVESLGKKAEDIIKAKADELFEELSSTEKKLIPPPGSAFSLAGDGVFEMTLESRGSKRRLLTSVDSVADGDRVLLKKAQELFAVVRGVGPVLCDTETFYGIGRKKSDG